MTRNVTRVVITGAKHAGKTSAGKELALLLDSRFIDLDERIEALAGKSPRALYADGPDVFRAAEYAARANTLTSEGPGLTVIAAGGGIIDNPPAMTALTSQAGVCIVYLEVSAAIAWERIRASGTLPLFLAAGGNPRESHKVLHERRGEAYLKAAHIIIKAGGKDPLSISREIAARLSAP